jgi:hypothetical protein
MRITGQGGRIGKRGAATLMAVACSLALQVTGAGATHEPAVTNTLKLGAPMDPFCQFHIGCAPFAGELTATRSPRACQDAEVHRNNPFTNIADIAARTGSTRRAQLKLVSTEGQGVYHRLLTAMYDANCNKPALYYNAPEWRLAVNESVTFTIPKGIKWFIVFGISDSGGRVILNDTWRLTFLDS